MVGGHWGGGPNGTRWGAAPWNPVWCGGEAEISRPNLTLDILVLSLALAGFSAQLYPSPLGVSARLWDLFPVLRPDHWDRGRLLGFWSSKCPIPSLKTCCDHSHAKHIYFLGEFSTLSDKGGKVHFST